MRPRFLATMMLYASAALTLFGCISSEETGAGNRARTPVQILGPIDTTRRVIRHETRKDTVSLQFIDSLKLVAKKQPRVAPRFKSKQDTVRASIVVKSKSSLHPSIKIERPEHPFFTVQIGAFNQASNALRTQKRARERFATQRIFNNFVKSAKLYRVSVGRYEDRKSAFALRDTMKKEFPQEYGQCWINFIP